ncbi:MAG: class I poly(R)-hydroxyalkanoic acid synthase [Rhizobacter sp.]|nr:class I poly(R)-hydroxyalkanoic acid synthase [Rhizobacter sp.]
MSISAEEGSASGPAEQMAAMQRIGEKSRRVVELWLGKGGAGTLPVSADLASDFMRMTQHVLANPLALVETQTEFWQDYLTLWQRTAQRMLGLEAEPVIAPAKDDRRFKHEQWSENAAFDFIKQSYLLSARCLHNTVRGADGLDDQTRRKVEFYTRQVVDALAPSNFAHTNPEVVAATLESGGGNLVKGLENLLDDLERGEGELKVSMTDRKAFELGRNIATSPGQVVFQNELMQLIQYAPSTKRVKRRPLLIIPPWINKFYILDLQAKNSFIKFCVDQGHTVFVLSWINPDERHKDLGWAEYMALGPLAALDAIEQAIGEREVNVIGYCIGGTLLATTLAWMAARDERRFTSATFFTSIMDFKDAGELTLFVDDEQLAKLERQMDEKGYLDAGSMATTFNLMRANDLIWSFVVSNYLLGKEPLPFDLLYWNSDSTRMPAATHRYYLRNMYQKNLLKEPGGLVLDGTPIDLRRVETPVFLLSAREDHIAPWRNTYAAAGLYAGPVRFVLAGSGHIAGVINPAGSAKYGHWTNDELPADPDAWLEGATQHPGSWWPLWAEWQGQLAGGEVAAREPGQGGLPALEPAPGSYVKIES